MISARKAQELYMQSKQFSVEDILQEIEKKIIEACQSEKRLCYLPDEVNGHDLFNNETGSYSYEGNKIRSTLVEWGYNVEKRYDKDSRYYVVISW